MERLLSNKVVNLFLALFVCALWGSLFPFVKIGYSAFHIAANDIPSIVLFAGLRFTVSGLALVLIGIVRGRGDGLPNRKNIIPVLLVSLFSIILHYTFTYVALSLGEGSKSAILKQVGFLFISCFAFLFDKTDAFSVRKLLAGILGFTGIIVTNLDGGGFTLGIADILLILASACSAASFIVSKEAVKKISPVRLVAYSQFFGGIILLLAGIGLGGSVSHTDANAVLVFMYICTASVLAYVLWNVLLRYNDLSKLSVIKFAEPLFAVIFSGVLLSETIWKLSYLVSLLIILLAILISSTGGKKHASTDC